MGIKYEYLAVLLFCAILVIAPVWGGRTANGTSDFLQVSMTTHSIFSNLSSQAQGTVSFFLNLTAFPTSGGSLPTCGVHCGEIVNVIAGHNAAVNGCQTVTGACLDVFVCPTTPCASNRILVDITTPNVGEAECAWPMFTGLAQYTFILNRTAANMAMYKNGVLVSPSPSGCATGGDPGPINYAGTGGGCTGGTCNLTVMASQGNASPDNFATGTISDLAFWNVTLNAGEITSLAHCVPPDRIEPEHVTYWPLYGVDATEPDYSAFGPTTLLKLTPTGTTKTLQQVGCQPGGAYH